MRVFIHKAGYCGDGDIGASNDAFGGPGLEVYSLIAVAARFAGRAIYGYPLAF
jgi:hypothetical protein